MWTWLFSGPLTTPSAPTKLSTSSLSKLSNDPMNAPTSLCDRCFDVCRHGGSAALGGLSDDTSPSETLRLKNRPFPKDSDSTVPAFDQNRSRAASASVVGPTCSFGATASVGDFFGFFATPAAGGFLGVFAASFFGFEALNEARRLPEQQRHKD